MKRDRKKDLKKKREKKKEKREKTREKKTRFFSLFPPPPIPSHLHHSPERGEEKWNREREKTLKKEKERNTKEQK